ncbi:MAG: hypothetical protein JRG90_14115 [Deltaproteobacteria bacterium]|nr:hypothetical protein [Deltaproteobacteria bacterium]
MESAFFVSSRLGLGKRVLRQQPCGAVEFLLGEGLVGDRLAQHGLLHAVADPDQHIALLDPLPLLEEDLFDHAVDLGIHHHRKFGIELTAEGRDVAKRPLLDGRDLDRDRARTAVLAARFLGPVTGECAERSDREGYDRHTPRQVDAPRRRRPKLPKTNEHPVILSNPPTLR